MLIHDEDGRVLACQLTYKTDWDLPDGVVEVGESPRLPSRVSAISSGMSSTRR